MSALGRGPGADTFVYDKLTDSYQRYGLSQSDLMLDFSDEDRIDLSALGNRMGNDHEHTLRAGVDGAGPRTCLMSYETDESGIRFPVSCKGDVSQYLGGDSIVFASTAATT